MLQLKRFISLALLVVTVVTTTVAGASNCEAGHAAGAKVLTSSSVTSSASIEHAKDSTSHSQGKESHQGHCHCSNQICCGFLISKKIEVMQNSSQISILSATNARPFSWNDNPLIRPPASLI